MTWTAVQLHDSSLWRWLIWPCIGRLTGKPGTSEVSRGGAWTGTSGLGTRPWYIGVNHSIFTYKQSKLQDNLTRSWNKTRISSLSSQTYLDSVWIFPGNLEAPCSRRASLSDNFPLGNERQKGIKRKLIMSVCWISQSCYLNLKNVQEIYEAKLLTQIGEDSPEQILPMHSGSCVRTLRSSWEGRSVGLLWRQIMNTARKKQLGDARRNPLSAEKNRAGYPSSQALSLMCALVQSSGREENITK